MDLCDQISARHLTFYSVNLFLTMLINKMKASCIYRGSGLRCSGFIGQDCQNGLNPQED